MLRSINFALGWPKAAYATGSDDSSALGPDLQPVFVCLTVLKIDVLTGSDRAVNAVFSHGLLKGKPLNKLHEFTFRDNLYLLPGLAQPHHVLGFVGQPSVS